MCGAPLLPTTKCVCQSTAARGATCCSRHSAAHPPSSPAALTPAVFVLIHRNLRRQRREVLESFLAFQEAEAAAAEVRLDWVLFGAGWCGLLWLLPFGRLFPSFGFCRRRGLSCTITAQGAGLSPGAYPAVNTTPGLRQPSQHTLPPQPTHPAPSSPLPPPRRPTRPASGCCWPGPAAPPPSHLGSLESRQWWWCSLTCPPACASKTTPAAAEELREAAAAEEGPAAAAAAQVQGSRRAKPGAAQAQQR